MPAYPAATMHEAGICWLLQRYAATSNKEHRKEFFVSVD